jgi:hypothetical protein
MCSNESSVCQSVSETSQSFSHKTSLKAVLYLESVIWLCLYSYDNLVIVITNCSYDC